MAGKHEVWVLESESGDPIAAECDAQELPAVNDRLGEQLARYVPERALGALRMDRDRLEGQLAMVSSALAGSHVDCPRDNKHWSPALVEILRLRVEVARLRLAGTDVERVKSGARLMVAAFAVEVARLCSVAGPDNRAVVACAERLHTLLEEMAARLMTHPTALEQIAMERPA